MFLFRRRREDVQHFLLLPAVYLHVNLLEFELEWIGLVSNLQCACCSAIAPYLFKVILRLNYSTETFRSQTLISSSLQRLARKVKTTTSCNIHH